MKKLFLLSVLIVMSILSSSAQSPTMKFDELEHNFGVIHETDGLVSSVFTFTNNGNEPIIVNKVFAGCGCTTPEWTQEPVMPGDKGEIKVSYNPKNRPGVFNKTITVVSNTKEETLTLCIKGEVINKDLASIR